MTIVQRYPRVAPLSRQSKCLILGVCVTDRIKQSDFELSARNKPASHLTTSREPIRALGETLGSYRESFIC